jgi:hypothetical protein
MTRKEKLAHVLQLLIKNKNREARKLFQEILNENI